MYFQPLDPIPDRARVLPKFSLIFQYLEETAARPGGLGLARDCLARANGVATVHVPVVPARII